MLTLYNKLVQFKNELARCSYVIDRPGPKLIFFQKEQRTDLWGGVATL